MNLISKSIGQGPILELRYLGLGSSSSELLCDFLLNTLPNDDIDFSLHDLLNECQRLIPGFNTKPNISNDYEYLQKLAKIWISDNYLLFTKLNQIHEEISIERNSIDSLIIDVNMFLQKASLLSKGFLRSVDYFNIRRDSDEDKKTFMDSAQSMMTLPGRFEDVINYGLNILVTQLITPLVYSFKSKFNMAFQEVWKFLDTKNLLMDPSCNLWFTYFKPVLLTLIIKIEHGENIFTKMKIFESEGDEIVNSLYDSLLSIKSFKDYEHLKVSCIELKFKLNALIEDINNYVQSIHLFNLFLMSLEKFELQLSIEYIPNKDIHRIFFFPEFRFFTNFAFEELQEDLKYANQEDRQTIETTEDFINSSRTLLNDNLDKLYLILSNGTFPINENQFISLTDFSGEIETRRESIDNLFKIPVYHVYHGIRNAVEKKLPESTGYSVCFLRYRILKGDWQFYQPKIFDSKIVLKFSQYLKHEFAADFDSYSDVTSVHWSNAEDAIRNIENSILENMKITIPIFEELYKKFGRLLAIYAKLSVFFRIAEIQNVEFPEINLFDSLHLKYLENLYSFLMKQIDSSDFILDVVDDENVQPSKFFNFEQEVFALFDVAVDELFQNLCDLSTFYNPNVHVSNGLIVNINMIMIYIYDVYLTTFALKTEYYVDLDLSFSLNVIKIYLESIIKLFQNSGCRFAIEFDNKCFDVSVSPMISVCLFNINQLTKRCSSSINFNVTDLEQIKQIFSNVVRLEYETLLRAFKLSEDGELKRWFLETRVKVQLLKKETEYSKNIFETFIHSIEHDVELREYFKQNSVKSPLSWATEVSNDSANKLSQSLSNINYILDSSALIDMKVVIEKSLQLLKDFNISIFRTNQKEIWNVIFRPFLDSLVLKPEFSFASCMNPILLLSTLFSQLFSKEAIDAEDWGHVFRPFINDSVQAWALPDPLICSNIVNNIEQVVTTAKVYNSEDYIIEKSKIKKFNIDIVIKLKYLKDSLIPFERILLFLEKFKFWSKYSLINDGKIKLHDDFRFDFDLTDQYMDDAESLDNNNSQFCEIVRTFNEKLEFKKREVEDTIQLCIDLLNSKEGFSDMTDNTFLRISNSLSYNSHVDDLNSTLRPLKTALISKYKSLINNAIPNLNNFKVLVMTMEFLLNSNLVPAPFTFELPPVITQIQNLSSKLDSINNLHYSQIYFELDVLAPQVTKNSILCIDTLERMAKILRISSLIMLYNDNYVEETELSSGLLFYYRKFILYYKLRMNQEHTSALLINNVNDDVFSKNPVTYMYKKVSSYEDNHIFSDAKFDAMKRDVRRSLTVLYSSMSVHGEFALNDFRSFIHISIQNFFAIIEKLNYSFYFLPDSHKIDMTNSIKIALDIKNLSVQFAQKGSSITAKETAELLLNLERLAILTALELHRCIQLNSNDDPSTYYLNGENSEDFDPKNGDNWNGNELPTEEDINSNKRLPDQNKKADSVDSISWWIWMLLICCFITCFLAFGSFKLFRKNPKPPIDTEEEQKKRLQNQFYIPFFNFFSQGRRMASEEQLI